MAQKFCTYCGAELKPGLKFCPKCGKPLRSLENAPTQNVDVDSEESNKESLKPILKRVFRVWDIVGSFAPILLWLVAFFFVALSVVVFYDSKTNRNSLWFFESFSDPRVSGISITVFILLVVQIISIVIYFVLVVSKKSKIGRIATSFISLALSISLLLLGYTQIYRSSIYNTEYIYDIYRDFFLLLGIMESVIAGLYPIGLVVSIFIKTPKKQESEEL